MSSRKRHTNSLAQKVKWRGEKARSTAMPCITLYTISPHYHALLTSILFFFLYSIYTVLSYYFVVGCFFYKLSRLTLISGSTLPENMYIFWSYSSVGNRKIIVQCLLSEEKHSLLAWPVILFVMLSSLFYFKSLLLIRPPFFSPTYREWPHVYFWRWATWQVRPWRREFYKSVWSHSVL